jgi:ABC-type oligopeptide transport system substrate-binding subunit
MKKGKTIIVHTLALTLLAASLLSTACASTRTEHGVQIQKSRNLNPLQYIPFL